MTLNITLLNTQSLKKHYKDIMKDQNLLDSDILCLTETQLQIDKDTSVIESRFQEYFKIMPFHNAISIIAITKPQFYEYQITIALVFRSPNSSIASFLDQVVYFTNAKTIDILLGDFNIDAFDGDAYTRLDEVLSSYRLMVKEPTHLDG